jgi:hypothetical protein
MTTPQRQDTTEPLVQRELATGALFPIGRKFSSEPRTDGRNSYGLTDAEEVAFSFASARVGGNFRLPSTFVTMQEGEYLRDSGQGAGFNGDKDAVIAEYRATHPLPTSLSTLLADDPSAFVESKLLQRRNRSFPRLRHRVMLRNWNALPQHRSRSCSQRSRPLAPKPRRTCSSRTITSRSFTAS